jgi:hypothetical protein
VLRAIAEVWIDILTKREGSPFEVAGIGDAGMRFFHGFAAHDLQIP